LVAQRDYGSSQLQTISFIPFDAPALVRSEDRRRALQFVVRLQISVLDASERGSQVRARQIGYDYRILDSSGHEIIAWHWHPIGNSPITHTHLHVSSQIQPIPLGRGLDPLPLADLHIPAGYVDLPDIVRFLIAEVGVRPHKRGWEALLAPDA
jgi:hypothetical protein